MANEKILDALMDIFNSAHYRLLTLDEVTEQVRRRGFYADIPYYLALARVNGHLGVDRSSANYPFLQLPRGKKILCGLETWFPPSPPTHHKKLAGAIEPLNVGWETQHTISVEGRELIEGIFPLGKQQFDRLQTSMNEAHPFVSLRCYAGEEFVGSINYDYHRLESKSLQYWYQENHVQPGDVLHLMIEGTSPLTLRIYTEWDRDADTYRRYLQRIHPENLPSTNLPIRDLVWLYFKRTHKVSHSAEIAKFVLAARPEISGKSVNACLSANNHLFARTGESGNWGLKEWGIGESIAIHPQLPSDFNFTIKLPQDSKVSLDYSFKEKDFG